MKKSGFGMWVVLAVIGLGLFMYLRRPAPDERIGKQLGTLCEIAESNVNTPSRGVDVLFGFFASRSPEMLRDFGDLLVEIESIQSDSKHDDRARLASRRIRAPLEACHSSLARFGQAIENDDKASEKLSRGMNRLGRTLGLIFEERGLAESLRALGLRP